MRNLQGRFFVYLVESIAKFLLIFSWNDNSSSKVYRESISEDTFNKDSQRLKISDRVNFFDFFIFFVLSIFPFAGVLRNDWYQNFQIIRSKSCSKGLALASMGVYKYITRNSYWILLTNFLIELFENFGISRFIRPWRMGICREQK